MNKTNSEKMKVYFNEYNVLMENQVYLPLVSGLLQAFAQSKEHIRRNYQFMPFLFMRDDVDKILSQYENPSVAVFSVSMWNANLNTEIARRVKEKYPDCLIIFGGPHVPQDPAPYFKDHPYVDITVRGDGEQTFESVLTRFTESNNFEGVPGISYINDKGECVTSAEEHKPVKDLDVYPSPYLEGIFDEIMETSDIEFQAIIETNRGCPFPCAFCFWGQGGLNTRFRFYSPERVRQTAEWLGKNKIQYVFCADSNFGMFKRDPQLASYFVDAKRKYGYPDKFRVCYGKNAEESIFETAKILTSAGLAKVVTLARQSTDETALDNVGRKNIKKEVYSNLQKRYSDDGMSTYTEIILGLPGETYHSFVNGLEEILQDSMENPLFIYHCQILPNTTMSGDQFMKDHKIETVSVPLNEVHAVARQRDLTTEYEDIVVQTDTLSRKDWKKATIISWTTQLFYSIKASFYIVMYLRDRYNAKITDYLEFIALMKMSKKLKKVRGTIEIFDQAAQSLLKGNSRCRVVDDFSTIYWEHEEAAFFDIARDKGGYYREMFELTKEFIKSKGYELHEEELKDFVLYQEARFPTYKPFENKTYQFQYNVPEFCASYYNNERCQLAQIPQSMVIKNAKDFNGDKKAFAREIMLYGRKSNKIIHTVQWCNQAAQAQSRTRAKSLEIKSS